MVLELGHPLSPRSVTSLLSLLMTHSQGRLIGYLLHGAPGSGKTSLIQAIAGALNLDVFILSLSKSNLDDTSLNNLFNDIPRRAIALIEDIDVAFTRIESSKSDDGKTKWGKAGSGSITLSGLLNAIDGIYAQEGSPIPLWTLSFLC